MKILRLRIHLIFSMVFVIGTTLAEENELWVVYYIGTVVLDVDREKCNEFDHEFIQRIILPGDIGALNFRLLNHKIRMSIQRRHPEYLSIASEFLRLESGQQVALLREESFLEDCGDFNFFKLVRGDDLNDLQTNAESAVERNKGFKKYSLAPFDPFVGGGEDKGWENVEEFDLEQEINSLLKRQRL